MKKKMILFFALSMLCISFVMCKKSIPTNINNDELAPGTWQSLEFHDKVPVNLTLVEPYLYVAAAKDGVWRRNIAQMNADWEYLGLASFDSTLGPLYGVVKVDIWGNDILAGLDAPIEVEKGIKVGIWRSCDGGKTWAPSDSGIRTDNYRSSKVYDLKRSPHDPQIILAGNNTIFRSNNNGESWTLVYPDRREVSIRYYGFTWHPSNPNLVWAYGQSGRGDPFLQYSDNFGIMWQDLRTVRFLQYKALSLFDLEFDAINNNVIYVVTDGGIFKSLNGGQDWIDNVEPSPPILVDSSITVFWKILCHPTQSYIFFTISRNQLYLSSDAGTSFYLLPSPNKENIFTLEFDRLRDMLYIGAADGIFRLKNPLNAPRIKLSSISEIQNLN